MQILPDFAAKQDRNTRRTRIFALLAKEQIVQSLTSNRLEDGLFYLHLISLPAPYWNEDTVEFADAQQLMETMLSEETVEFLCEWIDEVWSQATRLQDILRVLPYTEFFPSELVSTPLADEELTKALVQFSWHHKMFTPELVHLFLRLLADERSRQELGEILREHAKRELQRIVRAKFLDYLLNGHGGYHPSGYTHKLGQLEERGLIVRETTASEEGVRIRILAFPQPQPKQKKTNRSGLRRQME